MTVVVTAVAITLTAMFGIQASSTMLFMFGAIAVVARPG
jgi:hypothetical protein